jgi:hypothetical protein
VDCSSNTKRAAEQQVDSSTADALQDRTCCLRQEPPACARKRYCIKEMQLSDDQLYANVWQVSEGHAAAVLAADSGGDENLEGSHTHFIDTTALLLHKDRK